MLHTNLWYNVEKFMVVYMIRIGKKVSAFDSSASWVDVSRCEIESTLCNSYNKRINLMIEK